MHDKEEGIIAELETEDDIFGLLKKGPEWVSHCFAISHDFYWKRGTMEKFSVPAGSFFSKYL